MDFDKPLSKVEGYITYAILMDYIDTFVHEYTAGKQGIEFPSLRMTTDMILTLLNDFKNVDLGSVPMDHPREMIEHLGEMLEDHSKHSGVLDSRELGLFISPEDRATYLKDAVPEPSDLVISEEDVKLLGQMGINPN